MGGSARGSPGQPRGISCFCSSPLQLPNPPQVDKDAGKAVGRQKVRSLPCVRAGERSSFWGLLLACCEGCDRPELDTWATFCQ